MYLFSLYISFVSKKNINNVFLNSGEVLIGQF